MNPYENSAQPITTLFIDQVKPDMVTEYEAWVNGIHDDAKQFAGFVSIDIIQPQDMTNPEYIALVKFDHQQNLQNWRESENIANWVEQLPKFLASSTHVKKAAGLDLWFTRPRILLSAKAPPFWKQVTLGVITVYPLILILQVLLNPIIGGLPGLLSLFISVVVLSSLLTNPVMPLASKLLQNRLYSK